MKTITRYCISIVPARSGVRQIYGANQGRNFKDTPEAMRQFLKAIQESPGNREALDNEHLFGPGAFDSLAVSPVECYENGDAVSIFPKETL